MARMREIHDPRYNWAIKTLIERHDITQMELANRLHVSQANVSRWCRAAEVDMGKGVGPKPAWIPKIEDALKEPRGTIKRIAETEAPQNIQLRQPRYHQPANADVSITDFGELLLSTIKLVARSIDGDLSSCLAESIDDLVRSDSSLNDDYRRFIIKAMGLGRELREDLSSVYALLIAELLERDEMLDTRYRQMVIETYTLGREMSGVLREKEEQLSFPTSSAPKPADSFRKAS